MSQMSEEQIALNYIRAWLRWLTSKDHHLGYGQSWRECIYQGGRASRLTAAGVETRQQIIRSEFQDPLAEKVESVIVELKKQYEMHMTCFLNYFVDELSYREIGRQVGAYHKTVKRYIAEACRLFINAMEENDKKQVA